MTSRFTSWDFFRWQFLKTFLLALDSWPSWLGCTTTSTTTTISTTTSTTTTTTSTSSTTTTTATSRNHDNLNKCFSTTLAQRTTKKYFFSFKDAHIKVHSSSKHTSLSERPWHNGQSQGLIPAASVWIYLFSGIRRWDGTRHWWLGYLGIPLGKPSNSQTKKMA